MSFVIQLQFTVPSESWIDSICRNESATVKILSMKAQSQAGLISVTHFVDITSDKASAEELTQKVRSLPDVTESDLASVGSNRVVGAVTSNDSCVCSTIIDSKLGYFIGPAVTEHDCSMSYKLFMSGDGIPSFLQALHNIGMTYKITEISKISPKSALTSKQERVLKSALELGYYEYPKRASTEDLSKVLGIAPSTVTEILRRAERRIISSYFEQH